MKDGYADLPTVRIREVAELTGISPSTLRKYERLGLVLPYIDRPGGHRLYSQGDIAWLQSLMALFAREDVAPHEVGRMLSQIPARSRRMEAGADDCGVEAPEHAACWTVHAHDAAWRRQCRTCPGLHARKSVLSYSRRNWIDPEFKFNLMAQRLLSLREPVAPALFKLLQPHCSQVALEVDCIDLSVHDVWPDLQHDATSAPAAPTQSPADRTRRRGAADETPVRPGPSFVTRLAIDIDGDAKGTLSLAFIDREWPVANQPLLDFIQLLLSHRLARLAAGKQAGRMLSDASRRLATTVYEARSPLSALALHLDLAERYLKAEPEGERAANKLVEAKRFIVDTNRKLEAIYDCTRAELRSLPLERSRVDLAQLVKRCCVPAMRLAASGGKSLHLTAVQTLQGNWDEARLQNAVGSLFSWAVKCATTHDSIEVIVTERRGKARVVIKPFHVMPPPGEQNTIFAKTAGEFSNIGLLMMSIDLARQVAEAHGGTLLFEVDDDARTNLVVELPMRTTRERRDSQGTPQGGRHDRAR